MIDDLVRLRNQLHQADFKFETTPDLWAARYSADGEGETDNVVTVVKGGKLEGYAACALLEEEGIRAYRILEICATSREAFVQLIDQIIQRSMEKNMDFVFFRKSEEPYDDIFDQKKFVSFVDCVIMSAMLNPHKLLSSLSKEKASGKILKLTIKGFAPIFVSVGHNSVAVVEQTKPHLSVELDRRIFLELFFGKTSFLKEFLRRRIHVTRLLGVSTAARFFELIKQKKSYIPLGDWT